MDHRSISEYLEEIPSDSDCDQSDDTDEDLTWYPPKKTSKRDMITLFLLKNLVDLHTKSNIDKHAINTSSNSRCAIPKKTYSRQSKMGKSNETNSPRVLDELLLDSPISPTDSLLRYVDDEIPTPPAPPALNASVASDELQKTSCLELPGTSRTPDITCSFLTSAMPGPSSTTTQLIRRQQTSKTAPLFTTQESHDTNRITKKRGVKRKQPDDLRCGRQISLKKPGTKMKDRGLSFLVLNLFQDFQTMLRTAVDGAYIGHC
ncbi:hypothetical protein J6590_105001 [Homalodisca vitripennis]|nr:hypothetical protein J6590_086403 [Homalodisca vitripennis]KAG8274580.1 hypothetical protein J6590_105001 [Homalodisca vitripennis]